jgi:hypothetical protein
LHLRAIVVDNAYLPFYKTREVRCPNNLNIKYYWSFLFIKEKVLLGGSTIAKGYCLYNNFYILMCYK